MILPDHPVDVSVVARHYNEGDEFYREVWGEHVHHGLWVTGRESPGEAVVNLAHMVARAAGILPGMKVCDVGCGYGGTSRLLASDYKADVTGLTVSDAQYHYAMAQSAGQSNPRFLLCPWEDNDFAADSFDAVVSIESISHICDKPEFFRQIQRVLRPGGQAVVVAWLANPAAGAIAQRHLLRPICTEGRLPGLATAEEYLTMISAASLVADGFEEIGKKVRRTWTICVCRLLWKFLTRIKYLKELFRKGGSNRVFVLSLFRILIAYRTGSMQYGVFKISKRPDDNATSSNHHDAVVGHSPEPVT